MQKFILFSVMVLPTASLAHGADHSGFSMPDIALHLPGEPDHAVVVAAVVLVSLFWLARRRGQR